MNVIERYVQRIMEAAYRSNDESKIIRLED